MVKYLCREGYEFKVNELMLYSNACLLYKVCPFFAAEWTKNKKKYISTIYASG